MKQAPLYEVIYKELKEKVCLGTFREGDRLPSEKELSEEYHVSRITSKKALEMLSDEGTVVRMPGKGTFVAKRIEDLREGQEVPASERTGQRSRCGMLGVLLDGFGPSFGCQLLGSIEEECKQQGYGMILYCSYGSVEKETEGINRLIEAGVSGILIMSVHDENYNSRILQLVVEQFPIVTIDRQMKGLPVSFVGTDNETAARELTHRLLKQGCRRICFAKPCSVETSTVQERMSGFCAAFHDWGLIADEALWLTDLKATLPAYFGEVQLRHDMEQITEFISKNQDIDAFFAVEYSIARIIYRCLCRMGLEKKCPVVCFDSDENILNESMFMHVKQDESEIGQTAIRLLTASVTGNREIRTVLVPHRIVDASSLMD